MFIKIKIYMQKKLVKQALLSLLLAGFMLPVFSQDTTTIMKPAKSFSTFSIGVNVGGLTPSVPIGGSNNFTHPQWDIGYGAYIKNQFTHYLAVQADFLRGNVEGNNSD